MKRFVFSMKALLDAKMAFEEAAERRLAEGLRILQNSREDLANIIGLLDKESATLANFNGRHTNRAELLAHARYRHALEQMLNKQAQLVARHEAAVVELRERLRSAMSERQSIENVKKAEYRRWFGAAKRAEQKELDELSVQRFLRRPAATHVAGAG